MNRQVVKDLIKAHYCLSAMLSPNVVFGFSGEGDTALELYERFLKPIDAALAPEITLLRRVEGETWLEGFVDAALLEAQEELKNKPLKAVH